MMISLPETDLEYLKSIFSHYVSEWAAMFAEHAEDYGDAYKLLASKGQFSDINRKFWKLKRAVWDGKPLVGEQVERICHDMISHLFLLLYCWRQEALTSAWSDGL